jgi:hypothetical protein
MDTNIHDVEATGDVFGQVGEMSDSLSMTDAIAFKEALGRAKKRLEDALGLVNTQIIRTLDSPVEVGKKRWFLTDDGKWRPNHDRVRKLIVDAVATPNHAGEVPTAKEAAQQAVELTMRCYAMPSTMPKKDGLDRLGVAKTAVARWEKTGTKIETEDLEEPDE